MASIEFLLLANHVEVQEGLLYTSGAGWSDLHRRPISEGQFPVNHFGIATSILVPWDETNQPHHLTIRVEQEEGEMVLTQFGTDVEVGRPPGTPAGTDQRAILGLTINTVFPAQGSYRIVAEVGEDMRSVSFNVHDHLNPPLLEGSR